MKVIVDDKIPYIREALAQIADEAVYVGGKDFTPALVRDADALIVRTRTRCDARLLQGSRVSFIATATIGFDHIDRDYCLQAGIAWANAPGCNASSVAQYVQSALLLWIRERGLRAADLTLGVVGVGHVGSLVARVGLDLGMHVLLNDPPRQARGETDPLGPFVGLEELARRCDVLTLHVPLSTQGPWPTFHLADDTLMARLERKPLLLNTARGEVADTQALLHALDSGQLANVVIDVWEHEPDIDLRLLERAFLGTPHIAGYSADGKANATRMALDALCRHFGIEAHYVIEPPVPPMPSSFARSEATPPWPFIIARDKADAALQIYNPVHDSLSLKLHPEQFEALRGNYPLRREAGAYEILIE